MVAARPWCLSPRQPGSREGSVLGGAGCEMCRPLPGLERLGPQHEWGARWEPLSGSPAELGTLSQAKPARKSCPHVVREPLPCPVCAWPAQSAGVGEQDTAAPATAPTCWAPCPSPVLSQGPSCPHCVPLAEGTGGPGSPADGERWVAGSGRCPDWRERRGSHGNCPGCWPHAPFPGGQDQGCLRGPHPSPGW